MTLCSAAEFAAEQVARVRDDPRGRLTLLASQYRGAIRQPYRRAALAFMNWQLRRQLLNPLAGLHAGSLWWRAINERLLRDTCEAQALALGRAGPSSSPSVDAALAFIRKPTAQQWYRAHNATVVSAYLAHRNLAERETRGERFFMNVVLMRVLYAHALVAAPRLALDWLALVAPPLGDPRLGMTAIFLSLSRVLPDRYPIGDHVERYIEREHGFGQLLDIGVILPRLRQLYAWSARELELPALKELLHEDMPRYAWDVTDAGPWTAPPSRLARWARRVLPLRARAAGGAQASRGARDAEPAGSTRFERAHRGVSPDESPAP